MASSNQGILLTPSSSDERPIRVDHAIVGRNGNSVDGGSRDQQNLNSVRNSGNRDIEFIPAHPFGVLLNFTLEGGMAVFHPTFGEEAVQGICIRAFGKAPRKISRLNETDFLVEFDAGDNPTLFATGMGNRVVWKGQKLLIDAHIATFETLRKVSREREEARRIIMENVNDSKKATPPVSQPSVVPPSVTVPDFKESDESSLRDDFAREREDAMLKVLENMSRKLEEFENRSRASTSSESKLNTNQSNFPDQLTNQKGHRKDGVVLMEQLPRVGHFSGEKPTPKSEIDFKTWLSDVKGNLQNYPETSLRQGVRSSLRGLARELIEGLPTGATVEEIVDILKKQYGTVESSDQLMTNFFQMTQNKGEDVANFAARLVGALNKIQRRFPHLISPGERDSRLKDRLFHGMLRPYRDALRYLHSNESIEYYDFLEEARKVQECDDKWVAASNASAKSKSAQVDVEEDEMVALRNQVEELTATVKSARVNGPPSRGKPNQEESDSRDSASSSTGSFRGKRRHIQCWKCQGWGHFSRDCPSQGNFRRGEEQTPPPENQTAGQGTNQRENPAVAQRTRNPQNVNPAQNQ